VITMKEAKELQRGEILIDQHGKRWKVSGAVKTWKTDKLRLRVPLKHGLYSHDAITEVDFQRSETRPAHDLRYEVEELYICDLLTKE
jgi:succinate dehydrogenase/fumarate reductase flavoprotein subunit